MIQPEYSYGLPFLLTATGLVYTGPVVANGIIVSSHSSGTIKLWDNTAGSGTVLVNTITLGATERFIPLYGAKANVGIFATVGGTLAATLVYNPFVGG